MTADTNNLFSITGNLGPQLNIGGYNGASYGMWLQVKDANNSNINYPILLQPLGGSVAIGTASPSALLHLAVANAAVDGTKGVKITNPAGTTVMLECGVSSDSFVGTTSASDFSIRTGNSERMRITSGGSVLMGIGTNSASARLALDAIGMAVYDGGNYRQCYMNGSTMAWWNGSNQGTLSSAGVWTDASDISIKKDVKDIEYGLDAVLKLKPRSYKMKEDNLEQVGFIAQEVEEVIKELVSTDNRGMKGLSYGQLTAVLVKAIQELKAEIDELHKIVATK